MKLYTKKAISNDMAERQAHNGCTHHDCKNTKKNETNNKNEKIMKKTDIPQPKSNQATEDRIRKAGLFERIWMALQRAFHKVFPPLFYIALDMTLPLNSLEQQLDSIRRLKRTGGRVRVLCWRYDTEPFPQLPCNDCPKRPEYLTERIRRQEVVQETLYELFASVPPTHPCI